VEAFAIASVAGWFGCILSAYLIRGRFYAIFVGVLLSLHTLFSIGLRPAVVGWQPLFDAMQVSVYLNFLLLARPRMRSLGFRLLISIPSALHFSGCWFAAPWALLTALGFSPWGAWLSHAVAVFGVVQSLRSGESTVAVTLDGADAGELSRVVSPDGDSERPLRVVQITDPHLGPFMSAERLERICQRAVERDPDLILVTGDLLTMESQGTPEALHAALAPLSALPGRVFACMGNHDYEAPKLVRSACAAAGVELLFDDARVVDTDAGQVQILGMEHRRAKRTEAMAAVCAAHPRIDGALRLILLHDPGAFGRLGDGEADLVLSGHTHGGHVGLLSLGLDWTFVWAVAKMPDHGLWGQGRNRLYVHRGTGHYGFPLRLGVPGEDSLMSIHRPATTRTPA